MDILDNRSPTLTTTHYGEPVVCIEGNGSRPSHFGDGFKESQTMYTLNTTEVHGVVYAYDSRGNGGGAIVPTITGDHENRITDYTAIAVEVKDDLSESDWNALTGSASREL